MTFLIDAYNLMHAVGYLNKSTPQNRVESSRRRLLDWLGDNARTRPGDLFFVVFDGKPAPIRDSDQRNRINVKYAFQESADDVIVRMLDEVNPQMTTLVSNDNELKAAAKRARCAVMTCVEFVDWLITPVAGTKSVHIEPEKPVERVDNQELLSAFAVPKTSVRKRRK